MDDRTVNIEELLLRILEKKASKEEIRYFSAWIRVEENRIFFEKLKSYGIFQQDVMRIKKCWKQE